MKLVTFDAGEGPRTGAIIGDGSIVDLAAAAVREALADTGVAIAPGVDFDTVHGGSFVRLSFAGAAADISIALERMGPWLKTSGTPTGQR